MIPDSSRPSGEELLEAVKETHTDKDGNVVLLYTPDPDAQHSR